ncbi:MAG: hypothetical protein ACYC77_11665 [Coriobacteriia bacterium]
MSDVETGQSAGPNKGVLALLAVIVVLLGVIVAIILLQKPATTTTTTNTGTGSTATTAPAGMPPAATGEFDPATATKVADGVTPEQHVEKYFSSIISGDYQTAYDLLPADKKAAQDAASFGEQLAGYGITEFTMGETTKEGDDTKVSATATMAGGSFDYVWTFTTVDGKLVVKSRELAGMGG